MKATAKRLASDVANLPAHTIALVLAMGFVLGTFPVFGCPTMLCLLAALVLRLNLPALQLVNQLTSPLQIALLVPMARLGSKVFGASTATAAPLAWKLGITAGQAITGWFCISVPLGILLYFALACALRGRAKPQLASR